ncbi:hypothetical protein [Salinilacihabitans rarus]|uniref:hypothetical protein n=1 Tax=Salinilacihabitans rarus TaxID=2961596 RepID=UPI0020C8495B|nr:hypothetical protein [Salinilacihabitans rarus]
MTTGDGTRPGAARCDNCGTIGAVRVLPDGRLRSLGGSTFCPCETPELQLLEADLDEE